MARKPLDVTIRFMGTLDKSLNNTILRANGVISGFSRGLSKIGTAGLNAMKYMAEGTLDVILDCTKSASEFEQQMSDVVKYVDGLADATGKISDSLAVDAKGNAINGKTYAENYAAMKDALLDLSTQIPMTAEDLTKLAAAAGQSGKGITDLIQYDSNGNITGFLRDVAMMGTAMDIDAEQAGNWAAKWEKAFAISHEEVMVLADQINYLGANSATTAAEIAEAVTRVGSIGQIAGVDVATTAAIADAMLASGVESSRTATSIRNIFTYMSKGASATKKQKEMWQTMGFTAEGIAKSMQEDSVGTLLSVFEAINNLPSDQRLAAISDLFGMRSAEGAAKIAQNMQPLLDALEMVSDPSRYTGSMEREFIIKASTTEALDTMMNNALERFKIGLGDEFLPIKKELDLALIDYLNELREMPELKELAKTLADVASTGLKWLAEKLPEWLPKIQEGLEWVTDNWDTFVDTLKRILEVLLVLKAAPAIETGLKWGWKGVKGAAKAGKWLYQLLGLAGTGGTTAAGSSLAAGAGTGAATGAAAGGTLATVASTAGIVTSVLAYLGLEAKTAVDAVNAVKSYRAGNEKDTKTYGIKAGLDLTGLILPILISSGNPLVAGAGVALGGGLGAAAGGSIGDGYGLNIGQWLSDATDTGGWLDNIRSDVDYFFDVTFPEAWNGFWGDVGTFITEKIPFGLGYATAKVDEFWNVTFPQALEELNSSWNTFWSTSFPNWASDIWDNHIAPFFTTDVKQFFVDLWNGVTSLEAQDIVNWIANIGQTISGWWNDIKSWIDELWSGVKSWFGAGYEAGSGTGRTSPNGGGGKFAKGGFTHGPSIAGEAGTEAVISFLPSVRSANIAYWLQAGQMLGVDRLLEVGGSHYHDIEGIDPAEAPSGWGRSAGTGPVTFAPQITIQGNADRSVLDAALEEAEARFQSWYEQMQRRQFRTAY